MRRGDKVGQQILFWQTYVSDHPKQMTKDDNKLLCFTNPCYNHFKQMTNRWQQIMCWQTSLPRPSQTGDKQMRNGWEDVTNRWERIVIIWQTSVSTILNGWETGEKRVRGSRRQMRGDKQVTRNYVLRDGWETGEKRVRNGWETGERMWQTDENKFWQTSVCSCCRRRSIFFFF